VATDGSKFAATNQFSPSQDSIMLTTVCLHDDILAAQRAVLLPFALHDNEASYAEQMPALEPHRAVGDGEADWTQIVVELRHHGKDFARDLSR
jgi:hypothetical protein